MASLAHLEQSGPLRSDIMPLDPDDIRAINSVTHRHTRDLPKTEVAMAVVVQKMVDNEVSASCSPARRGRATSR